MRNISHAPMLAPVHTAGSRTRAENISSMSAIHASMVRAGEEADAPLPAMSMSTQRAP